MDSGTIRALREIAKGQQPIELALREMAPRCAIAALVFLRADESVLLVKQSYGGQYWSLPGGGVEHGETIDTAAIREVREETGLDIRITRIVGMYVKRHEEALAVTFEGEIVGGTMLQATAETSACRYWPCDKLPTPIRVHLIERVEDFRRGVPEVAFRLQQRRDTLALVGEEDGS